MFWIGRPAECIVGPMMQAAAVVSMPAMRVWIREQVESLGPVDCDKCGGRRAHVCIDCKGQGGRFCSLDHEHTCRVCSGSGFSKCKACTERIEWEQIPRPQISVCGVELSAWDLLDALRELPGLVAHVQRADLSIVLRAGRRERRVEPLPHYEPRKLQPVFDYPDEQMVLPFERTESV
jgi:hypothetical protein